MPLAADITVTRCDIFGQNPRTISGHDSGFNVTEHPSFEHNTFGKFSFTLPPNATASAVNKYDEVVIAYRGVIVWWGVVVTKEAEFNENTSVITFRCADLLWYMFHRYVGKARRTNYAIDPNFEADSGDPDFGAWATVGTITFTRDGTRYKLNGRSAKIVSASANEDWFIYEDIIAFTATGVGDVLTISGWFFVEDSGFIGPALGNWGMALVPYDGGLPGPEPPAIVHIEPTATGRTPRGSWQFGRAKLALPPNAVRDLQVRLYAVGGTIRYGAIQVVRMESLSSVTSATDFTMDQAKLMELLVQHAQDASVDKDDVNIDTACPDANVRIERHYQYVDHALILRALQEFPAMGGPDFWIDWTAPATPGDPWTRTFRTPTGSLARGSVLGMRYRVGPRVPTARRFKHVDDGDRGRSSVTLLGFGDGPDREEAGAIDTSGTNGRIVEEVIAAPVSTDIDALQGIADGELDLLLVPDTWEFTVSDPGWIGNVRVGDQIPVEYDEAGDDSFEALGRVMSLKLNMETLELSGVLNRP